MRSSLKQKGLHKSYAGRLYGTEKGTRTPTAYGHYHLKVACLPIPPPRQNRFTAEERLVHPQK